MAALRRASGRGLHILVRLVRSFAQRSLNLTTALPVVKKSDHMSRVDVRPGYRYVQNYLSSLYQRVEKVTHVSFRGTEIRCRELQGRLL